MASREKSFTGTSGDITYTGTLALYKYEYDLNNNLTRLAQSVNGHKWNVTYTYDKDNRPETVKLDNGVVITTAYGSVTGRYDNTTIALSDNNNYVTDVLYKSGAEGSQTTVISSYQNGSDDTYKYTYDKNGNITKITQGDAAFSYVYDSDNQLTRENLYYGNGNSNNATYVYTYDGCGNLLSKTRYAYTTGKVSELPENVESYTYSNTTWGDQLTGYSSSDADNQSTSITYDAMGNPVSYFGATLTWEGKQLNNCSIASGKTISYDYDENGLRTQKTVNSTVTKYYYNGSTLMGMTTGTGSSAIVQLFSYDASGKVVAVDYSKGGSNFTTYYYLRNAQGDIVKLIDGSGATVVEYLYDTWGKLLEITGTLKDTVGTNQPFRYRGYVYDNETVWYYLKSRYYNSEIGQVHPR